MKKKIAFVCLAALLSALACAAEAFADDDDRFRCQAIVSWNGEDMCGVDKAKCAKKAKHEAVEEACEKLCKDEDACEDACVKDAKVVFECKDLSGNIVMSEGTVKRCEKDGDKGCCKTCPKWDKSVAADAASKSTDDKTCGCGKPTCQCKSGTPCGGCKKHAK